MIQQHSPRISVAMATHNGERFLREQLDSLFRQSRLPDEVVVSDDASTDGTVQLLQTYSELHPLRVETHAVNIGVNANFFHALACTTGEWICICDQDDIWLPEKIETLGRAMQKMDQARPAAVSSSRIDVNADGEKTGEHRQKYTSGWKATLLTLDRSQGCTMMINRRLLERALYWYNNSEWADKVMYDVLLSVVAAVEGEKINLPDPLMLYRHHDRNVVDRAQEKKPTLAQHIRTMRTYYPFLIDYRISELSMMSRMYGPAKEGNEEALRFMQQMHALDAAAGIREGLGIVIRLKSIGIGTRILTAICTPAVKAAKRIIK